MYILSNVLCLFFILLMKTLVLATLSSDPDGYEYIDGDAEEDVDEVPEYDSLSYKPQSSASFESRYVGTNLLDVRALHRKCFSPEDESLLAARMDFESLLPHFNSSFVLETDQTVDSMLQYFYGINEIIDKFNGADLKLLSRLAMSDLIGGYLNYFYVPLVKLSFYAGTLEYSTAIDVLKLQTKCKRLLNTNGNGWRKPRVEWFKANRFHISPLNLTISGNFDADHPPCVNLILSEDEDDADSSTPMLVLMPKLELANANMLGNIWLPFKRKHNFNLSTKNSAFILLRYYVAVQKCYAFKGVSPKKFHRRLSDWLSDRILPYLDDNEFYPGLGAVLRIVETIQSQGKRYTSHSNRHSNEMVTELPISNDFMQIEKQVDKIIQERTKPGILENISDSFQRNSHRDNHHMLVLTIGVFLICMFIIVTSCCWMCKRGSKNSTKKDPQNNPSKLSWISLCCRCCKKRKFKEDEFECVPESPSVLSRRKEEELFVKNLDETRRDRLSSTNLKNSQEKIKRSKRSSSIKVMKSCCFTSSQKRNSSQSSLFRPIGTDQPNANNISDASLSDFQKQDKCKDRSIFKETSKVSKQILDEECPSARSGKSTRIPMFKRKTQQNCPNLEVNNVVAETTLEKPCKISVQVDELDCRRFERKPYVPLMKCSKRIPNQSHSSWETLPSEKR